MRLFGKKTVSETVSETVYETVYETVSETVSETVYEQFIKELEKKIGIYVYLFVILFSLGKNEVLFEDYVKQFDNKNFYFDTESEAFMRYLSEVEKEICIEKTNNCIEVLSAKLERGEFMCKLDPKDLKKSVDCILNVNKNTEKTKDYLYKNITKNHAYYYDIYDATQMFIVNSKLRSY